MNVSNGKNILKEKNNVEENADITDLFFNCDDLFLEEIDLEGIEQTYFKNPSVKENNSKKENVTSLNTNLTQSVHTQDDCSQDIFCNTFIQPLQSPKNRKKLSLSLKRKSDSPIQEQKHDKSIASKLDRNENDVLVCNNSTPSNLKNATCIKENKDIKTGTSNINKVVNEVGRTFLKPSKPLIPRNKNSVEHISILVEKNKSEIETDLNISNFSQQWTQNYELELSKRQNDILLNELNEKLRSQDYKRSVSQTFESCLNTIHVIAPGQDYTLSKVNISGNETLNTSDSLNHIDWDNDSLINNIKHTKEESFADKIKNALKDNINNDVKINNFDVSLISNSFAINEAGPFFGLPEKVKELIFQYKGISDLYDWQTECLNLDSIKERKNLIYSLPTSGGKTLVAEILLLREIICNKRNVLFILPFVSIVQEKVWALSPFAVALEFLVEEYAANKGMYPPRKRKNKHCVYIATIEKALGLVNSLVELGRMGELGLIIVDELHLLGEKDRGVTLEILLTKVLHSKEDIQIIGMSATIGNLDDLCKFLNASKYAKDFRPVELLEYIKCEEQIAKVDIKSEKLFIPVRSVDYGYPESVAKLDPDHLGGLVTEVIPDASCLIFCATKQNCENVALLLSKILFSTIKDHKKDEKEQLCASLQSDGHLCPILKKTIPFGVAYHHSGLTTDERKLIEDSFRAGVLYVICCTSTLAAGVNLPAKRVILRSPYVGCEFISLVRYKQMCGRAGRAGLEECGDSILICTKNDLPRIRTLLTSSMEEATSHLHESGLERIVLSAIGLKVAITRKTLCAMLENTFMAIQKDKLEININELTDTTIKDLIKCGALSTNDNIFKRLNKTELAEVEVKFADEFQDLQKDKNSVYIDNNIELVINDIGKAAVHGNMEIQKARLLYDDLIQAQTSLVLINCLHLLYLITPYEFADQIRPDMTDYYNVYAKLGDKELCTARVLGITENCAMQMMMGAKIYKIPAIVLNRFYLSMILYDVWNQQSIYEVAVKFKVNRGLIQQLLTSSAHFASSAVRYCEELPEFWAFSHLFKNISSRLTYCCTPELVPLMELPSVKKSRARQLFAAGYKTIQSVAKANPYDLSNSIEHVSYRIANQLIASAKMILLEKVENLRDEAEEVLEGLN